MKIKYDILVGPPPRHTIEQERKHQERLYPIVAIALAFCFPLGALTYLRLRDVFAWQAVINYGLACLGIFAAILIIKLIKIIRNQAQLAEAHPVTARAYLSSSDNPTVLSYCIQVLEQGRNLTMAEAEMLFKTCTEEEIVKLAAYYEEHAPLSSDKDSGFFTGVAY